MSFASLKSSRKDALSKLATAAEKLQGQKYEDNRFWSPTVDKVGNGYAIIRFLPAPEGEDLPWVRFWDHGFQGPTGRWYIENSLTTLSQPDPVSEHNSKLWNSGIEADKEVARKQKRRLHYVSNIEVISDPANPANDGKQFLYKFGKKIFDKIEDAMQPEFADEEPANPFDFWGGGNFKLKIRIVEGYRNYDKSEFEKPAPHRKGDDAALEEIYKNLYSLKDFVDPKNYKPYAELQKKLNAVLGGSSSSPQELASADQVSEDEPAAESALEKRSQSPAAEISEKKTPKEEGESDSDDDESSLAYFSKLAKGDGK